MIHAYDTEMTVTDYFPDGNTRIFKATWNEINVPSLTSPIALLMIFCASLSLRLTGVLSLTNIWRAERVCSKCFRLICLAPRGLEEWWLKVVQPPFATNATILFSGEAEAVKSD